MYKADFAVIVIGPHSTPSQGVVQGRSSRFTTSLYHQGEMTSSYEGELTFYDGSHGNLAIFESSIDDVLSRELAPADHAVVMDVFAKGPGAAIVSLVGGNTSEEIAAMVAAYDKCFTDRGVLER